VLAAFWSGLGGEFAKHWAVRILTPAFAFWAGGLAIVWWSGHSNQIHDGGWSAALSSTARTLEELPAMAQVVLVLCGLLLLAASGLIAERLTLPLLRLLEGYWSRPAWLRRRLVARRRGVRAGWSETVESLRTKQARGDLGRKELIELRELDARVRLDYDEVARLEGLKARARRFSADEAAQLARGAAILRNMPREDHLGMPTRLGDILRAAERRPGDKYGLDAVVCWYRLWTVLPADTRSEVAQVRLALDSALRTCLWGALFLVWTPWLWWAAVPIGIVVPLLVYRVSMLSAATLFGDLVETAFDMHRMQLYDALHLPRPTSAADERRHGELLTKFVWHGDNDPAIVYVAAPTS
jgi:hypothetical protein